MIRYSISNSLAVWILTPFLILVSVVGMAQEPEFAEQKPLAEKSLLLDISATANGWVAVGERGHILVTADGESWKQASSVPTKSTLTSVFSLQGMLWAAGHEATILQSTDGGDTWELQFQDIEADAIMDIVFIDKNHGFAMGAYGQLLETTDGGKAWDYLDLNSITIEPQFSGDEEDAATDENDYAAAFEDLGCYETLECHLNAMVVMSNQRLLIVGERGYGFRSNDNGKKWQAIHLPYEGSMFGALLVSDDCVLAFGLRGHAFRSCDFGSNWEVVETNTESSLLGGTLGRQSIVLVGANGVLVEGPKNSLKLQSEVLESGIDYTAIATAGRRRGLLTSTEGVSIFAPEAKQAGEGQ